MPVNATHREYTQRLGQWTRCRDAYGGTDAIKAKGETYLPRLADQTITEYEAYRDRALWYGATARTVQGLGGAVMRKPPTIEAPEALDTHLENITLTGVPIEGFTKWALEEILVTGRVGILVDMPRVSSPLQRPYWVPYTAEQILNWRVEIINGVPILTMVVLSEEIEDPGRDPFETEPAEQFRVLSLVEARYQVELWRRRMTPGSRTETDFELVETIVPTFRGAPLGFIPFTFIGANTITSKTEKPPLLELVDVNLSHYRSSADLEHGRHFCGLPTPWIAGFPKETKLRIGSSVAWVATDPNAKAGMLEFTGKGLGALEKALDSKERLMAVLGARLLEEPKTAVEAAETMKVRFAGERSVLQTIAGTVGIGFSRLLRWHALWAGLTNRDGLSAKLNTDFMSIRMTSQELTALMGAWQSGAISYETFYWNLAQGEVARPGVSAEEERQLIDQQPPTSVPLVDEEEEVEEGAAS